MTPARRRQFRSTIHRAVVRAVPAVRADCLAEESRVHATIGLVRDCANPTNLHVSGLKPWSAIVGGEGSHMMLVDPDGARPKLLVQAGSESGNRREPDAPDQEMPDSDTEASRLDLLGVSRLEAFVIAAEASHVACSARPSSGFGRLSVGVLTAGEPAVADPFLAKNQRKCASERAHVRQGADRSCAKRPTRRGTASATPRTGERAGRCRRRSSRRHGRGGNSGTAVKIAGGVRGASACGGAGTRVWESASSGCVDGHR